MWEYWPGGPGGSTDWQSSFNVLSWTRCVLHVELRSRQLQPMDFRTRWRKQQTSYKLLLLIIILLSDRIEAVWPLWGDPACHRYLRVLFTTEGEVRVSDRYAVMRLLHGSVRVTKDQSCQAKLSIDGSFCVPTLVYGHELWGVNERMRTQLGMGFLCRTAGWSATVRNVLRIEPC